MIDTVCLTIPQRHLILMDENNTRIPSWHLYARTDSYTKYVRNPSRVEKDTGLYFPRITAYSRKYQAEQQIKIEFSVPKLIYLNNLEELFDEQFDLVIETLQDRLRRMGVSIFKRFLIDAPVTSVHFGRNIKLQGGQTATNIISQIGRIDLRKSFDFARARYINDGQSLCCHTSSHELVFYDKIADLRKGRKRAIDRDQTKYQMSLFETARNRDDSMEVLRMEVRLSKRQKLNSVFKKLSLPINPTFKQVFNSTTSNKVLWEYWNEIIKSKNIGVFIHEVTPIELLKRILVQFPEMKPKQAIFLIGLTVLSQSNNGLRELRTILANQSSDRSWSRMMKEYRESSEMIGDGRIRSWVQTVEQQLKTYQPLKLSV